MQRAREMSGKRKAWGIPRTKRAHGTYQHKNDKVFYVKIVQHVVSLSTARVADENSHRLEHKIAKYKAFISHKWKRNSEPGEGQKLAKIVHQALGSLGLKSFLDVEARVCSVRMCFVWQQHQQC